MRITNLFRRAGETTAACCDRDLDHCHGTLVLHADGTTECDQDWCDADEARHELWVSCGELRCSCAGDDAPLDGWLLAA